MILKRKKKNPEALHSATQWRLIWVKFKSHKPAVWSFYLLIAMYGVALFAGFFTANPPTERKVRYRYLPPTKVYFQKEDCRFSPHVFSMKSKLNP